MLDVCGLSDSIVLRNRLVRYTIVSKKILKNLLGELGRRGGYGGQKKGSNMSFSLNAMIIGVSDFRKVNMLNDW